MITITVPQYWTTFKTLSDLKILQRWQCDLSNVHFFNGEWLWKEGDEDYFARVHKYHWSLSKFYFAHFIAQGHEASRRPHDIFTLQYSFYKRRFWFEVPTSENSRGSYHYTIIFEQTRTSSYENQGINIYLLDIFRKVFYWILLDFAASILLIKFRLQFTQLCSMYQKF